MQKNEENEQVKLVPITVRFSEGAMKVFDEMAQEHNLSKAEIIRLTVDNRLINYLGNVSFVNHEDAVKIREEMYNLTTELELIKRELNRIGLNFNQELKLKHIEKKYQNLRMNFDDIMMKQKEEEEVKKDTSLLNQEELEALLSKYDDITKRVGDVLCRILV